MKLVGVSLALIGASLMLLAAAGVLRFPDALTRLHPGAKVGALGTGLVLCGSAFYLGGVEAFVIVGVAVLLVLVSNSLIGHLLARAAYLDAERRAPLSRDDVEERLGEQAGFAEVLAELQGRPPSSAGAADTQGKTPRSS